MILICYWSKLHLFNRVGTILGCLLLILTLLLLSFRMGKALLSLSASTSVICLDPLITCSAIIRSSFQGNPCHCFVPSNQSKKGIIRRLVLTYAWSRSQKHSIIEGRSPKKLSPQTLKYSFIYSFSPKYCQSFCTFSLSLTSVYSADMS